LKIAILGGTGDEGLGLAMRWTKSGEEVIIGSRSAERALEAAHTVREAVPFGHVTGMANDAAADAAEVIIVSVPYGGQRDTLTALAPALAKKVVISVVVPLQFGKGGPKPVRVAEGSAAEEARAILADSKVASAFHNLSATKLMEVESSLDCDVVVCADDADAKQVTFELAGKLAGVRPLDGGGLGYSSVVEDLTALLISMNRRYKAHASVKFTGIHID
jgi:NADPH-dependent F420 reductase